MEKEIEKKGRFMYSKKKNLEGTWIQGESGNIKLCWKKMVGTKGENMELAVR